MWFLSWWVYIASAKRLKHCLSLDSFVTMSRLFCLPICVSDYLLSLRALVLKVRAPSLFVWLKTPGWQNRSYKGLLTGKLLKWMEGSTLNAPWKRLFGSFFNRLVEVGGRWRQKMRQFQHGTWCLWCGQDWWLYCHKIRESWTCYLVDQVVYVSLMWNTTHALDPAFQADCSPRKFCNIRGWTSFAFLPLVPGVATLGNCEP